MSFGLKGGVPKELRVNKYQGRGNEACVGECVVREGQGREKEERRSDLGYQNPGEYNPLGQALAASKEEHLPERGVGSLDDEVGHDRDRDVIPLSQDEGGHGARVQAADPLTVDGESQVRRSYRTARPGTHTRRGQRPWEGERSAKWDGLL